MVVGRMSIYLPDELEARTRVARPGAATSQIVRTALEHYLGAANRPAYAEPPGDVEDLLAAGVAHLAELARADYQDGYRVALRRLAALDWSALTRFADAEFDLHGWLEPYRNGITDRARLGEQVDGSPAWFAGLADDLGSTADPIGFDRWRFKRTEPFERGYADGLRAGYEAALGVGAEMTGGRAAALRADSEELPDSSSGLP